MTAPGKACIQCGIRYRQAELNGLCKRCARLLGTYRSRAEFDALFVAAQRANLERLRRPAAPPREPRFVTVNGVRFEIIWDGS